MPASCAPPRPARTLRLALMAALVGVAIMPQAGCYRKVVNSRGIGADSTKLRSEHEGRQPKAITTQSRREIRRTTPAHEREKP